MILFNLKPKKSLCSGLFYLCSGGMILVDLLVRQLFPLNPHEHLVWQTAVNAFKKTNKVLSAQIDIQLMKSRMSKLVASLPKEIEIEKIYFHQQSFRLSGFSTGIEGFYIFCQRLKQIPLLSSFQMINWQEDRTGKAVVFRFVLNWS